MTEDDARKKWCPFARVVQDRNRYDTPGVNRISGGLAHAGAGCLASACMAWRWYSREGGYCGLAGSETIRP